MSRLETAERKLFEVVERAEREIAAGRRQRSLVQEAMTQFREIEQRSESALARLRDFIRSVEPPSAND